MGLLTRTTDTVYAFRFLRLLTTPWTKMGAYKMGLIDANGNILRKPETSEEKSKYNIFHKLVFNIKRMLNVLPFGKTTIASYLAALYLIKEKTGVSDRALAKILKEATGLDPRLISIEESFWYLTENNSLRAGLYTLTRDLPLQLTGDLLALRKTNVLIAENSTPVGNIFGINVYSATHCKTGQRVLLTQHDIIQ
jgi:hypothetical protein